jgi:DNA-binding MarR family transcriptional regulator
VEAVIQEGSLTAPQTAVMHSLVKTDGLSLKQLCRDVSLAHSTVSGIVDRLEARGLVKRQMDKEDRRATRIMVSDEVRTFMQESWPKLEVNPLAEALARATDEEVEAVTRGIQTLRRLLETRTEPAD